VKHQGNYNEFEKINVKGTKEVLNFCMLNKTKLCHISTLSISGDYIVNHLRPEAEFSENDLFIGQYYMDNPYVRSKFEAECLVWNYIREGLPAAVVRLGFVTGRYSDGKFQFNKNENTFYNIIKAVIKAGILPVGILGEKIDLSPVDILARGIVNVLYLQNTYGRVIHLHNFSEITIKELSEMIGEVVKRKFEKADNISYTEYLNRIRRKENDQTTIDTIASNFNYERILLNKKYRVILNSGFSREYTKKSGFGWPEIDMDYVEKILKYIIE
jgi:thioester reductase-like protein